jgi:probable HAF family extracellular repeat protein
VGPDYCAGADPNTGGATGINSSGTIIGSEEAENESHGEDTPFTYSNGVLTVMDVPCGISAAGAFTTTLCPPSANYTGIDPIAINDAGNIVGTISWTNSYVPYAFLAINSVWTDLGIGTAYAINASGEVTGTLFAPSTDGPTYAFLYKNGTTTNLGRLPGGSLSTGYAINATGQNRGFLGIQRYFACDSCVFLQRRDG